MKIEAQRSLHTDESSLSDKSDIENKESLNLPPVYVIYRDNNLFQTLVPKIAEDMQKIGRKVVVHAFPKGTSEEEIKAYFENEETKTSLKDVELLTDSTCDVLGYKFREENLKDKHNLDSFSSKIMGNSLIGKEVFEGKESEAHYSAEISALQNIIKKIITEHGEPENFYLVEDDIDAHNFTNYFFNNPIALTGKLTSLGIIKEGEDLSLAKDILVKMDQEALLSILSNDKNFTETIALGFDKNDFIKNLIYNTESRQNVRESRKKVWIPYVIGKIKDSLKGIISEDKIKIVADANDIENGDNNYVLIDRHGEHEKHFKSKIKLPLPFASMMEDIIKNKLLNVDFDVDEAVRTQVEKTFKK